MNASNNQAQHLAKGMTSFFFLNINFILSSIYFSLLISGFALAFGLIFILIGLPLIAFMIAATRKLAIFDRQFSNAMLGQPVTPLDDPMPFVEGGLLARLSAYLASPFTWQSAFYMFLKFPISVTTFSIAWSLFPFWLLELLLNFVGMDTGQIIARMMTLMASGSQAISDVFIGENLETTAEVDAKPKRQSTAREADDLGEKTKRRILEDTPESVYYLDDEGEIVQRLEKP